MSSSDSTQTPFVRTTGLDVTDSSSSAREQALETEVRRLRGRVTELQGELRERDARIEDLETELEEREAELANAQRWAGFLDEELESQRDRVETLESRVEALESGGSGGLLGRLRSLF